MPLTIEQRARARLVTSADAQPAVLVTLRYDGADPLAVHVTFPPEVTLDGRPATWTFARDLLEAGLRAPSGEGDVHVWPCGRAQTILEFHSPDGVALVQMDTTLLRRFLLRSYAMTAPGDESAALDLDRGLRALMREA
ncbi:SsgA family sporulation/cell division regulator [Streptomyces sp. TRM66268-LWL]|uniref:SsgA family sporulation/cell division regulator n=1 Tax=Streptomyces polyasparticus TaxID=2767826 RepID=A0ABR7SI92_9ACTN|nr:SsgA family sporulation/cell division regulator [Streptomyces polyasparticus]MBC9715236.1 SsgA family sporulation/cell division regulator [Streptomyces polyasparticus]